MVILTDFPDREKGDGKVSKIYKEPACDIPIYDVCDILVVGGGLAGHSAAAAAACAGAKDIIL